MGISKLSAIFALVVTFAAASTGAAAQPDSAIERSSDQPITVHFEVVADTLPKARQAEVATEVDRQFAELAVAGGLLDAESNAADLVVRLEFTQPNPKADVVVIHALALYAGDVLRRDEARTCMQCTSAEIAASGLLILEPAVEEIDVRRARAAAQREAEARAAEPPPSVDVAPAPVVPRIGPIGYAGIASSAVGLGSIIGGAVLVDRGRVPTSTWVQFTDYRPPGHALIGVGLGLMVVGNVLLAVDLGLLGPRRRARARARIDGVTLVAANGPGVVVSGRF